MTTIGITMGCPVGIGPEIICKYFSKKDADTGNSPVVVGDLDVLKRCRDQLGMNLEPRTWTPETGNYHNTIPVISVSRLKSSSLKWGNPDSITGKAAGMYVEKAVELIQQSVLSGMTTCPLSKESLNIGGYQYPGHTEMLANLTNSEEYAMMLAGDKLRVTLVTIHCSLKDVASQLNQEAVYKLIGLTHRGLSVDLGINRPRIAVAGFNPHCGESGLFGDEEQQIIRPAIQKALADKIDVDGPFPPDTIFVKAAEGNYDGVVCMYHDQGLIPFKLLHFSDGVNITLGLPIVRTSVDHGTAYDIAGKGVADPTSLRCAVQLAETIAQNRSSSENR